MEIGFIVSSKRADAMHHHDFITGFKEQL